MKKTILIFSAICLVAFLVRGFGSHAFLPNPPKRSLVDAYLLATQALGTDTNSFYCVAAKMDREVYPVGAWIFTFDQNGMTHRLVYVAMEPFNRDGAWGDYDKPWPLTKVLAVEDITHTTNSVPDKIRL
jgi:hypothetical protein